MTHPLTATGQQPVQQTATIDAPASPSCCQWLIDLFKSIIAFLTSCLSGSNPQYHSVVANEGTRAIIVKSGTPVQPSVQRLPANITFELMKSTTPELEYWLDTCPLPDYAYGRCVQVSYAYITNSESSYTTMGDWKMHHIGTVIPITCRNRCRDIFAEILPHLQNTQFKYYLQISIWQYPHPPTGPDQIACFVWQNITGLTPPTTPLPVNIQPALIT